MSGLAYSSALSARSASVSRAICAAPRRGGSAPPVRPTRSPPRSSSSAMANARSRARSALSGRAASEANRIEAAGSTQSITLCATCHSRWRTNCASERAERRQSIMVRLSPG